MNAKQAYNKLMAILAEPTPVAMRAVEMHVSQQQVPLPPARRYRVAQRDDIAIGLFYGVTQVSPPT